MSASTDVADAYDQYLLGRRLERRRDVDGAIAAYKRAIALDPAAADMSAELAGLYLRQNRVGEAITAAEQALKIAPANCEAHRVLGTIYAAVSEPIRARTRRDRRRADENAAKAIATSSRRLRPGGEADPNLRATLARMYVRTGATRRRFRCCASW